MSGWIFSCLHILICSPLTLIKMGCGPILPHCDLSPLDLPHYFTPKFPLSTIFNSLIFTFHNFLHPNFHFPQSFTPYFPHPVHQFHCTSHILLSDQFPSVLFRIKLSRSLWTGLIWLRHHCPDGVIHVSHIYYILFVWYMYHTEQTSQW